MPKIKFNKKACGWCGCIFSILVCCVGCLMVLILGVVILEFEAKKAEMLGNGGQVIKSLPTPSNNQQTVLSTSAPVPVVPSNDASEGGPQIGPMLTFEFPTSPESLPMPEISIVRIEIPKIGVGASVVDLGLEQNGAGSFILAPPEKASDVVHFSLSSLPGGGKAIFLHAHIKWHDGNGAFINLHKLDPSTDGSIEIYLYTSDGQKYKYIAVRKRFLSQIGDKGVTDLLDFKKPEEILILGTCHWPYIYPDQCQKDPNCEKPGYQDRLFIIAYPVPS